MTPSSMPPATTSVCDHTSCACGSNFGDILIFLRRVATDADRTNDFVFEHDRNTTLQRRRPGRSLRQRTPITGRRRRRRLQLPAFWYGATAGRAEYPWTARRSVPTIAGKFYRRSAAFICSFASADNDVSETSPILSGNSR